MRWSLSDFCMAWCSDLGRSSSSSGLEWVRAFPHSAETAGTNPAFGLSLPLNDFLSHLSENFGVFAFSLLIMGHLLDDVQMGFRFTFNAQRTGHALPRGNEVLLRKFVCDRLCLPVFFDSVPCGGEAGQKAHSWKLLRLQKTQLLSV